MAEINANYQLTPLPEASHVIINKPSMEVLFCISVAASREEHRLGDIN